MPQRRKPGKTNLSSHEQMQIGLEYAALAYEYHLKRRGKSDQKSLGDVVGLMDDLRKTDYLKESPDGQGKRSASGGPKDAEAMDDPVSYDDRKYRNYLKKLTKIVPGFAADFQRAVVQKFSDARSQKAFVSFYLKELCFSYNDEALELYLRNLKEPTEGLFRAVILKYSIVHKLRVILRYASLDGRRVTRREILPLSIAARRQYLDLIALDLDANGGRIIKQFAMSGIQSIESDLYSSFYDPGRTENPVPFDLESYDQNDPAARFGRNKTKFRLRLHDHRLEHFRQSYALDYRVLSREGGDSEIEVTTHDHRLLYSIVFDYGEACELLSPDFAVAFLAKKFADLAKKYAKR